MMRRRTYSIRAPSRPPRPHHPTNHRSTHAPPNLAEQVAKLDSNSVDHSKVTTSPTHKTNEFPAENDAIPSLLVVTGTKVGQDPKAA